MNRHRVRAFEIVLHGEEAQSLRPSLLGALALAARMEIGLEPAQGFGNRRG